MKYLLMITIGIYISFNSFSQEKETVMLKKHSLVLNLLSPGAQYELKVGERNSLVFNTGIRLTASYRDVAGFEPNPRPFIQTSYRKYYDRKKVNRSLGQNSGNYIGAVISYDFNRLDLERRFSDRTIATKFVWGIQRNYNSNIHFGFNTELGLSYFDRFGVRALASVNFQLGFIIK